jgi:hypothetical protein
MRMWRWIKWGFRIVLLLIVAAFLHYTLPQRDVVRIIDTYNRVTPIGANWIFYSSEDTGTGAETSTTRDIRFINAVFPDGETTITYRNEDTGWFWPPYFKWDSSTLQAEAGNYQSAEATPRWVAVTHYGWRVPIISVFPNAVKIVPVAGPDVRLFPWLNLVILGILAFLLFWAWMMLRQFRERMVDPAVERVAQTMDAVDQRADAAKGRLSRWLASWRAPPKR